MKIEINIEKRHLVFLVVFVSVVFVIGVSASTYTNTNNFVGHDANETGPGIFGGDANSFYGFPGNLNIGKLLFFNDQTEQNGIFWGASSRVLSKPHIDYSSTTGLWVSSGSGSALPVHIEGNLDMATIVGYNYVYSGSRKVDSFDSFVSSLCGCDLNNALSECGLSKFSASESSSPVCYDRFKNGEQRKLQIYKKMPLYAEQNANLGGSLSAGKMISAQTNVTAPQFCIGENCVSDWPSDFAIGSGTISDGETIPLPQFSDGSSPNVSNCHFQVSPKITGLMKIGSENTGRWVRVFSYADSAGKAFIGVVDSDSGTKANCPQYIWDLFNEPCHGDEKMYANYLVICTR